MEEGECGKEETKDWQTNASVKQTDMEGCISHGMGRDFWIVPY